MKEMKYLIVLSFLFTLFSCGDDAPDNSNCTDLTCPILGEWEWTHTYGSIAGSTWTPDNTGMTKKISMDDTHLTFFEDGNQVDQFTYEVFETDTMFQGNTLWTFIRYDNWTRILEATDSTLQMRDFCPDCYDDYYIKN